jgi:hypothetical protein
VSPQGTTVLRKSNPARSQLVKKWSTVATEDFAATFELLRAQKLELKRKKRPLNILNISTCSVLRKKINFWIERDC